MPLRYLQYGPLGPVGSWIRVGFAHDVVLRPGPGAGQPVLVCVANGHVNGSTHGCHTDLDHLPGIIFPPRVTIPLTLPLNEQDAKYPPHHPMQCDGGLSNGNTEEVSIHPLRCTPSPLFSSSDRRLRGIAAWANPVGIASWWVIWLGVSCAQGSLSCPGANGVLRLGV